MRRRETMSCPVVGLFGKNKKNKEKRRVINIVHSGTSFYDTRERKVLLVKSEREREKAQRKTEIELISGSLK